MIASAQALAGKNGAVFITAADARGRSSLLRIRATSSFSVGITAPGFRRTGSCCIDSVRGCGSIRLARKPIGSSE